MIRADGVFPRHGSYKWKPTEERDFIAIGWNEGTGKHKGRMGALVIAEWQYGVNAAGPPKLVNIGNCGTGFSDAERVQAIKWKYPRVVTIQFMFQQPDTRALREPRFIRCEDGKKVTDLR
jgi:ATP-dependent DNA ligase